MATQTHTLQINGMSCQHCVRSVRSAIERLRGVEVEAVEIGSALVHYDDAQIDSAALREAVEKEGYVVAG